MAGSTEAQARLRARPSPPVPHRGLVARISLRAKRLASHRAARHLIRAIQRYLDRLGTQFAGAMTYFSFLSLVPILMVGFAVAGIVLANNEPLLTELEDQVTELLPPDIAVPITAVIDSVVANPLAVGIPGLLIALYSGIGWMRNLRKATRALCRPEFDRQIVDGFVLATAKDLGSLIGLGVAFAVSVGLTVFGSRGREALAGWLGLAEHAWSFALVAVLALLVALAADVLIFLWIYTVLPGKELRSPLKARLRGSILAAIGFQGITFALTTLVPDDAGTSPTAVVFGSVIGLLFFLNLTAQLVLFVAAWVATATGGPELQETLPEVPSATAPIGQRGVPIGRAAAWVGATAAVSGAVGWGAGRRGR